MNDHKTVAQHRGQLTDTVRNPDRPSSAPARMTPGSPFADTCQFTDDVLGSVWLNRVERDCIDTPEYRRLFRLSQLGLVDRLYHTANHTRGIHSIGVCVRAKHLVERLNRNTPRLAADRRKRNRPASDIPPITFAEKALISLAGLLHDLPHGPFSHDIEKKTHHYCQPRVKLRSYYGPYSKHDDFEHNPVLHILLFDTSCSVLARVLKHYSSAFWDLLLGERLQSPNVERFVDAAEGSEWARNDLNDTVLASLIFHLLAFEDLTDALGSSTIPVRLDFDREAERWGLGKPADWNSLHRAWYQPYRHDIIGNTLSADLLDYLARDAQRLGMRTAQDEKLLHYYVLVNESVSQLQCPDAKRQEITRCAIDLNDYKRGGFRAERINDVFRLLDFRHEIHEKAIHHRIVQSAIAMLGRALMLAGTDKPQARELYNIGRPDQVVTGDDHLLQRLAFHNATSRVSENCHLLGQKLLERRLYRPLVMLPGDEACRLLGNFQKREYGPLHDEERLRLLGAILDSRYFAPFFCLVCWCIERLLDHSLETVQDIDRFLSEQVVARSRLTWARKVVPAKVILWTTPYKQLYKDPAIVIRAGEHIGQIDHLAMRTPDSRQGIPESLPPTFLARLEAGIRDSEARYASMWKIHIFISDGLYYSGGLARLLSNHKCRADGRNHVRHLEEAQDEILLAIETAWEWWSRQEQKKGPRPPLDLDAEIAADDFVGLLEMFRTYSSRRTFDSLFEGDRRLVCGVDLEQYAHVEPNSACKDVRYRFDETVDLKHVAQDAGLRLESEAEINALFGLTGVDLRKMGHEEVVDIMRHLGPHLDYLGGAVGGELKAAREGERPEDEDLRRLWLSTEAGAGFDSPGGADGAGGSAGVLPTTRSEQPVGNSRSNRGKHSGKTEDFGLVGSPSATRQGGRRVPNRRKADSR